MHRNHSTSPADPASVPVPVPTAVPDVLAGPSGYHLLYPDISVNFQLNRWLSAMTPRALADVAEVAARAPSYRELIAEFLALGDRLLAAGRRLDAAFCYRAAEFFLTPDDQRKAPARRRFIELVRGVYGIGPQHLAQVPYQGVTLPVVRFGEPHRGTVVLFGGFDSYLEERVPAMLAFAHAGHEVIAFEGPGQGAVLEDHGMPMTPDWHLPLGAVLDHFRLQQVTLVGISLGGGLAIRAAAREPRVARVIADDVLTDFLACNLRQLPAAPRVATRALLRLRTGRLVDALAHRRMRHDLLAAWGIAHGQRVLGAQTPYQYLQQCKRYVTADVSPRVTADVLLLAGAADHYVPTTQLRDQVGTLTSARSVTARVFTPFEQAHNHCQVGNIALSLQVMLDWLDGLDRRDAHRGATAVLERRSPSPLAVVPRDRTA